MLNEDNYKIRSCSILAATEGEPLDGTAPEKDSAIFFPAEKTVWHRVSLKEKLQGYSKDSDLGQAILPFKRPLVCYYRPNELTRGHIFFTDSSGIKCFSKSGLRINREVKHLYAVCTDGKKDKCCAKFGIPVSKAFSKLCEDDEQSLYFETSHIGGCRFAATSVCFPSGNSYGRILPEHAIEIKNSEKNGIIVPNIFRGNVFVSEIHCWIMRHSMEKFGYVPSPEETEIVNKGEMYEVAIKPDEREEFDFNLIHREVELDFFSGCSNIESGRSITRSIYDFTPTDTRKK